jgi:tRNA threonylcarbamoyl adenosine modification protein YjeE
VVGLSGDLGAGKSEFARATIRARAGLDLDVPSPTFTLLQLYELPGLLLGHADLYRLASAGEVLALGLDEVTRQGALLVEWPERADDLLPAEPLMLSLAEGAAPDARILQVAAPASWTARLEALCP